MSKSMEIMAEEISAQAKLFELCGDDLIAQTEAILERTKLANKVDRVYITGCGDSWCAGIACRDFFFKTTKLPVEVHQAIEFSRYVCPAEVSENSIVLSISSSGRVARTVECAMRAKEKHALSIGVTRAADSKLAAAADEKIVVNIPDVVGIAPGTQSYIASILAIMTFAIALGKNRGTISQQQVDEIFATIAKLNEAMKLTVKTNFELIKKYIAAYTKEGSYAKIDMFHILGSGPNWGTAQFGSMKLLEASGFDSIPQGVEEWAHTQYFTTRPGTHTVVIAPRGESRERVLEVLQAVGVMDGKRIVIGEEHDDELARSADIYLPICGMDYIPEEYSPLIYPIPLELMALHMSEALGVQAFEFDAKPWRKAENFRQIFGSKIRHLGE